MTDTPQHIKELQLKIWLSKSPGERLRLTLEGNGQLLQFWSSAQVVNRNTARREAYKLMLANGYATNAQGVVMQQPDAGYNREGVLLIDDWR